MPVRHGDGRKVSRKERADIIAEIWGKFGGLTVEGTTEGHWIDPTTGKHYHDECWKLIIVAEPERWAEIERLIIEFGRRLGQEAMYVEVQYFDGVRILRVE